LTHGAVKAICRLPGWYPEETPRLVAFSLLVSLASTEDGGLRVVPGITPSFLFALLTGAERVPRVLVHRTVGKAAGNGSAYTLPVLPPSGRQGMEPAAGIEPASSITVSALEERTDTRAILSPPARVGVDDNGYSSP